MSLLLMSEVERCQATGHLFGQSWQTGEATACTRCGGDPDLIAEAEEEAQAELDAHDAEVLGREVGMLCRHFEGPECDLCVG